MTSFKNKHIDVNIIKQKIDEHPDGDEDRVWNLMEVNHQYTKLKTESIREQTLSMEELIKIKNKTIETLKWIMS